MSNRPKEDIPRVEADDAIVNTADLVRRAKNGDAGAFRDCVRYYAPLINSIAYQMLGNSDDARDVAQEVFIRLYRSLDRFDADYSFTTWLYRLTVNLAIDFVRKRRRQRLVSLGSGGGFDGVRDNNPGPDVTMENSQLYGAIAKLLRRLSINQRRVFVLRDLQGFTTDEVATILKCRPSTVRVHLARARRRIKEALMKYHPDMLEVITDEML
jgi:RNA polymerase sigma-70 factor (ECF subfamily)